jgi:hypothetical protein
VEIVYERVAATDVGKKVIAVAVRTAGERVGKRRQQVCKYNTFHQTLAEMVSWLSSQGATHVTMEATGVYWKPIFHALCEAEQPVEVLLVNARHVKNVPGRKSDLLTELPGRCCGRDVRDWAGLARFPRRDQRQDVPRELSEVVVPLPGRAQRFLSAFRAISPHFGHRVTAPRRCRPPRDGRPLPHLERSHRPDHGHLNLQDRADYPAPPSAR